MLLNTFNDFRSLLRDDTRRAWSDLMDRRRGEHICAFALVTSDDFLGASAIGDTIERREQRLAIRPPRNRAEAKYHEWAYAWNTGPASKTDFCKEISAMSIRRAVTSCSRG